MKRKFTLLIAALALLTMIVQPGRVWGQESYSITYDVTAIGNMFASGSSYASASGYWKVPAFAGNSAQINIPITYQPDSDITITFRIATFGSGTNPSASNTTITAIGTETNSNWSGTGVSSYPSSSTYVNGVMTISKPQDPTTLGGLAITMGVNSGIKIFRLQSIAVEYTYSTGGGDLEDNDLTLSPTSLALDIHNNPNTGTVTYTTSSTGAVTVSQSEYVTTSVSGNTITVTPVAVTPSEQTITVSQAADATYAAGSATFTVNVTNSAPTVTVTYHANGGTGDNIEDHPHQGSNYTVAGNTFTYSNHAFTKWNTNTGGTGQDYNPEDVINNIQNDIDLYAQWEESSEATATLNIQSYATANNWSNSVQYLTATVDQVTFTAAGGGNTGKYYINGQDWRFYQNENATLTISVPNGYHLVSITPTFSTSNSGVLLNGSTSVTSNSTVSASGTSVTFSVGNSGSATNGQVKFTNIVVIYESEGGSQSQSDLTITNASTDLTFDLYPSATAQVINYTTSSTGAITITPASPTTYFSYVHDAQNKTITVTPLAVTPSAQIVTISQAADDDYYAGTATFTVSVANSTPLANIAALTAQTTASEYTVALSNAVVTYVGGSNAYIQDASGAVMMHKSEHGLTAGDVLNGTATVAYQLYNANPQITNLTGVTPVSGTAPDPTEVAQSAWNYTFNNVLSQYFKVTGATITQSNSKYYVSLNNENIQLYKQGGSISTLDLTKTYSITGFPTLYNSTKELTIYADPEVETSPEPSITVANATVNVTAEGGEGTLTVSYDNITEIAAEVWFCNAEGTEDATYDWITASINANNNVEYLVEPNDGEARTAYFEVWAYDDDMNEVYSNLVTINQEEYVAPTYATLPFSFDGGRAAIATTNGLYQEGLGDDYNNSPKLRFDNTGDWLLLQFSERPGTLTFKIKGNGYSSGSTSTFKVQTSADGTTYTDLATYTELGDTQTESFDNLDESVRYIKWIYTEKGATSGGNVALGDINLAEYVEPVASITVNPDLVEATAAEAEGNLAITLENITISQVEDHFEVYFCDENGTIITEGKPNWLIGEVQLENNVFSLYYMMYENTTSESRTAYIKVYGISDDGNTEAYSNKITFTQAGTTPKFAVIFDLDGGTFVANDDFTTDIVEKEAGTYTLPSATKENINFAGWLLDGTETIYAAGAQYQVTADALFTAQWSNAVTATITFGSAQGSTNINNTSITGDDSAGNTWTITTEGTTSFTPNAGYAQIGSSSQPATSITFTTTLSNDVTITAFSAKFGGFSGTAGTIFLKVGETTVGTGSLNATADVTVNNTSTAFGNVLTVTVTNIAKGVKAYNISYTYTMSTDPMISAPASIDLASDATAGEIEYSIINPATGVNLEATSTTSWISNIAVDNDKVTFTTTANTETTERQGTITLSYQGADDKDVTIIQAAYVPPVVMENYALFTGDLVEGDYIIYYNGKAMNNVVSSGRLQYAEIEPDNNVIATDNAAIVWHIALNNEDYWTIYSADANAYAASTGAKNKAQMLEDGTDDMAMWTVTEIYGTYEFVNKANAADDVNANLRNNGTNGWACYSTQTGGALTLYKKAINIVTYNTTIAGYGDSENGGYRLIASPVSSNPADGTGMIAATPEYYDLFIFDQTAEAEWYNYKAHNFYLTPGKGYLYANKEGVELSFNGMPYEGDGNINLTYDENAPLKGWNLIGNPYGTSATLSQAYYRLNADGNALNAATESTAVNLMEGVFVKATEAGQIATFTAQSKNEAKAIAQTNIMVSNAKGSVIDNAIVRFDGGSTLEKFSLRDGSTQLYIPQNDYDYAIVSADAEGDMPLNFKAETTGQYTIRIKIDGASVGYMHLIDKLAGKDINLLINPEYSFIGSPRDAEDRFIIRFTEIDANNIFAYQNGSDIIVNGNGELQVFDVTGRMVMNTKINGIQTVNVPATGMYIFRMVGESVQTQKIVVR